MSQEFVFILLSLAVWRLTHLVTKEDGPFDLIYHIRRAAGAGFFGSLLDCFYCVSIWVAAPFGIYAGNNGFEKILYWLSLSGAACLLEQLTTRSENKPPELPDYKED